VRAFPLRPKLVRTARFGSPKVAPINARAETLATSPMFGGAFRRHRCLVVADGFYEWRKNDGRRKTPFFIRLKSGRLFGFAGVWSMKHGEKESRLATCAIATCPPNELMANLHDRMPVILPPGARDRWLDPTASEAELRGLLVPLAAGELNAQEVSALVNSPPNESAECMRAGRVSRPCRPWSPVRWEADSAW